jgi:two-component system OmpR family sensor kinase
MRLNSLYTRLALGLVVLVLLLGGLYVLVMMHAGRLYFNDLNQQLNRELAANLIAENGLSIDDGDFDRSALEAVFHTYMVVNPSIEVYLIDNRGQVLAYSAPPGEVTRKHVDLAPVRTFLRGDGRSPVVGDDPRDAAARKVFSAAPIGPPDQPQGYLYVVLAGQQLDSVAGMLQGSYVLRLALYSLLAVALASVATGLLLLRLTTRRLRRLDHAMGEFEAGGFARFTPPPDLDTDSRDELGRLSFRFARMAERITSQLDALRQSDALRRELVANVSHDLRTPIASLQGYLETLLIKEDSLSPEQRRDYLSIALRHGERLGRLVTELFELAKLDSGHTELNREPFAPGELVQDVALKYRLAAQREGVGIQINIPPDLPFVDGDIGLIERVLENLLDNAIRHTPRDGRVTVTLAAADGRVNVQVADTGCGIAPEKLPLVFDRFYQGQQGDAARDAPEGIGLGLAIAKRIMDLHASTIAVDSAPQAGTRFDFSLPACA